MLGWLVQEPLAQGWQRLNCLELEYWGRNVGDRRYSSWSLRRYNRYTLSRGSSCYRWASRSWVTWSRDTASWCWSFHCICLLILIFASFLSGKHKIIGCGIPRCIGAGFRLWGISFYWRHWQNQWKIAVFQRPFGSVNLFYCVCLLILILASFLRSKYKTLGCGHFGWWNGCRRKWAGFSFWAFRFFWSHWQNQWKIPVLQRLFGSVHLLNLSFLRGKYKLFRCRHFDWWSRHRCKWAGIGLWSFGFWSNRQNQWKILVFQILLKSVDLLIIQQFIITDGLVLSGL